jgi:hypothetical protein
MEQLKFKVTVRVLNKGLLLLSILVSYTQEFVKAQILRINLVVIMKLGLLMVKLTQNV